MSEKIAEAWNLVRRPGTLYGALKMIANEKTLKRSEAWLGVLNSGTYKTWPDLKVFTPQ